MSHLLIKHVVNLHQFPLIALPSVYPIEVSLDLTRQHLQSVLYRWARSVGVEADPNPSPAEPHERVVVPSLLVVGIVVLVLVLVGLDGQDGGPSIHDGAVVDPTAYGAVAVWGGQRSVMDKPQVWEALVQKVADPELLVFDPASLGQGMVGELVLEAVGTCLTRIPRVGV